MNAPSYASIDNFNTAPISSIDASTLPHRQVVNHYRLFTQLLRSMSSHSRLAKKLSAIALS